MGSDQQQFCLRWHNYQSSLLASLPQFLDGDDLTDVTLSAGGRNLRAHRVVLSACSQYFREIFKELQPFQHPVIVLPGMNFRDLCALVTFMYSGEVNIYQEQLPGLLSMADTLHIRGLAEVNGANEKNTSEIASTKPSGASAIKRPKLNVTTSPNHVFFNNSTNEDNLFKSPFLQSEPKNYKDLNENNTNKSAEFDILKNFNCKFNPFDDSTLKMMSNSSKSLKGTSKGKSKKPISSIRQMDSNVFSNQYPIPPKESLDLFYRMLPMHKKSEGYKFSSDQSDLNEAQAQDLSKVRVKSETEINLDNPETDNGNDLNDDDPNITPTANVSVEMKSDMQSPSSDDSGGGNSAIESFRDTKTTLGKSFSTPSQSKVYATCYVCGKQLSNQYNLRVHLETHQNVQYACTVCNHVSRSRDALRKHVSYRHPSEGKECGNKKGKGESNKRPRNDDQQQQQQSQPQPQPQPPPQQNTAFNIGQSGDNNN